jgi:(2R)-sulfolactate sulfo-lyase subunit alpha
MPSFEESTLNGHTASADGSTPAAYVRLGPDDNVVVLARHVDLGDSFQGPSGETWTMSAHLDAGNKLAAAPIAAGERVIKVCMPIGTATRAIAPGEHVHSHNLRSDYLPTESE